MTHSPEVSSMWQRMNSHVRALYKLILTIALVGQVSGAARWLKLDFSKALLVAVALFVFAVVVAVVLELSAVVLINLAAERLAAGKRLSAAIALIAAGMVVTGATSIAVIGHWGPDLVDQAPALTFATATLLGMSICLIQMDWAEAPEHKRRRAVRKATAMYVQSLDMDDRNKAVLLASVDADQIASAITGGLDNTRIAKILSDAIDPSAWQADGRPVVRTETVLAPTPDRLIDTGEIEAIRDGAVPDDAPVSPAPWTAPRQDRSSGPEQTGTQDRSNDDASTGPHVRTGTGTRGRTGPSKENKTGPRNTGPNKAAAVLEARRQFRDASAAELTRRLQDNGIDITDGYVRKILRTEPATV